jgi:hypothetical protein
MKTTPIPEKNVQHPKVRKGQRNPSSPLERISSRLMDLARWWASYRQPAEVTVMLRLVEIVGLVLVVLILAAVGKIDELVHVFSCLQGAR